MKSLILLFPLFLLGCKVDVGTNENEQFKSMAITGNVGFAVLSKYVLTPSCVRCHSWAGDEMRVQQRIAIGDPTNSILYQKVKAGTMPPNGALSSKQLDIIARYINNPALVPIQVIPINSTFKSVQFHLIEKSCLSCHNNKDYQGKFNLEGYDNVVENASAVIDNLDFGEMSGELMPPLDSQSKTTAPIPTKEIKEAFRKWIAEGKLNN